MSEKKQQQPAADDSHNSLQRPGNRPAVQAPVLSEEVKTLGRRARERLDEERNKRREIVRVNSLIPPVEGQKRKPSLSLTDADGHVRKRSDRTKSPKKPRRSPNTRTAAASQRDVDRWLPDTSHLPACTKQTRSNVVQLHGLPIGTSASHIRRFFSGLDTQQILILPFKDSWIHELDANYEVPRKRDGLHVKRYGAHFRVLAKFDAAPTADLAVDRSGELMHLPGSEGEGKMAQVAVTQLPKRIASYLLKNCTIEVHGTDSLEDELIRREKDLDSSVLDILWTAAVLDLKLQVRENTLSKLLPRGKINAREDGNYERLEQLRKSLTTKIKDLRYQEPFPSADALDLSLASDPIVFLTTTATKRLQQEVDRIDRVLLEARRWPLLQRPFHALS